MYCLQKFGALLVVMHCCVLLAEADDNDTYNNFPLDLPQRSYTANTLIIPGRIEAEDFDHGGEGVAYHDFSSNNQGGNNYRSTAVDIAKNNGFYSVGWTVAGEWLEYTVDIKESATYQLRAVTANDNNERAAFHVLLDGNPVGEEVLCPKTGSWQKWTLTESIPVELVKGRHILRIGV